MVCIKIAWQIIHGPCAIIGCEYLCTWFAYIHNIDVQIVVPPPNFCYTFECYPLLFAMAFMDCHSLPSLISYFLMQYFLNFFFYQAWSANEAYATPLTSALHLLAMCQDPPWRGDLSALYASDLCRRRIGCAHCQQPLILSLWRLYLVK